MKPKSWKTTAWGILGIALTVLQAVMHYHATGQIDPTSLGQITAGLGLIAAADHSNLAQ